MKKKHFKKILKETFHSIFNNHLNSGEILSGARPYGHRRPSLGPRAPIFRHPPPVAQVSPDSPGSRPPGPGHPSTVPRRRFQGYADTPIPRLSGLGSRAPGSRLSAPGLSALGRRVLGSLPPGSRLSGAGLSALGRRALGSRPPGARDRGLPEAQPAGDGASSAVNLRHQRRVNQYGNEVCNISYTCTSPPSHLPRTTDSGIPAQPRKADHDRESVSLRQSIGRHGTIERNQRREARRQPAVAMATNS